MHLQYEVLRLEEHVLDDEPIVDVHEKTKKNLNDLYIRIHRMNLDAEYKDFFENLGEAGTYTYKFFDLFRINLGNGEGDSSSKGQTNEKLVKGLHWGKEASEDGLTDDQLKELKSYLKAQKAWIRKEKTAISRKECRRKMWFFVQKLIELGAFCRADRRDIITWMDNFHFLIGVRIDDEE